MEPFGSLVVALVLLILLAVTSLRYGVDSRDGFRARQPDLAPRGGVRDVPSPSPKSAKAVRSGDKQTRSASADCGIAPCPS